MSSFTSPLIVQPLNDKDWKLIESFEYHVGSYPSNEIIQVPKEFITDFASVPQLFWFILPPWGTYGKAAVIHDYCYNKGLFPRKRCDDILLEAMIVLDVAHWKRKAIYDAVRIFGWGAWNKHRRKRSPSLK